MPVSGRIGAILTRKQNLVRGVVRMDPRRVAAFSGVRILNESGLAQVGLELANLAWHVRSFQIQGVGATTVALLLSE